MKKMISMTMIMGRRRVIIMLVIIVMMMMVVVFRSSWKSVEDKDCNRFGVLEQISQAF